MFKAAYLILFLSVLGFSSTKTNEKKLTSSIVHIKTFDQFYKFLSDTNQYNVLELSINGGFMDPVHGYELKSDSFFNKLGGLVNLKKLNIESCELKEVPPQIFKLKNLEIIELRSNKISYCPPFISKFKKLKELDMCFNQITTMDSLLIGDISNSKLVSLSLSFNQIKIINPDVCKLRELSFLHFSYNQIENIPCCLSEFELFEVSIENNPLNEIPECFCRSYQKSYMLHFSHFGKVQIPKCLDDTNIPINNRIYIGH
jgi:Leucine-rich repeat (LRR) protein